MAAGILRGRVTELGKHRRIEAASVDELIGKRRTLSQRSPLNDDP